MPASRKVSLPKNNFKGATSSDLIEWYTHECAYYLHFLQASVLVRALARLTTIAALGSAAPSEACTNKLRHVVQTPSIPKAAWLSLSLAHAKSQMNFNSSTSALTTRAVSE